ncbi:bifunctional acetaldehyde-CoA/alcohol dehydrogenase [Limosilactobacillus reuteri]|jgi:acetaldehyde dehydrogenase/alcohol dehydrogenase|uniref:Aldehyde-alcohol dehydrogenase n=3 Tax=Limosilactobacillus reuteri TaxID=1598 RepID=A0A1Y2UBM7_LIMRT|nr:bifunctional acetaldehyde-CoA/alcohol dehydrogenase [Limosilactobacillus reuteri]CCC04450.1 aldehyde-alcohol dehydrogenase [Limosilactobacillus reuteri subsp. suis]MCC4339477.1 bifunctional acetaldehyde-CoA/alcohol dehydrogenase [Limosilactobacillus reuteri]MCC4345707.1 bifunctional acetaldehyde-CoA/alcohol dehydrogenase [Limosilactobacillus reuteri]MCC4349672.1 bifunctional acetaldehyde-CoA/alcohol dehydrogenase [Limosilactobacillus reuteri]MCC4360830.1 bifunctional acetaldehyde-CoA/alcoho
MPANNKKQVEKNVLTEEEKKQNAQKLVDDIIAKSEAAFEQLRYYSQEQVDKICQAMALAAEEHHMDLAIDAAEETGRGVAEDKAIKNIYASEYIWNNIRHDKTVGIIEDNDENQTITIADPLGIIAGIVPVTNPTSTTIFKSIISAKTRNTIIFSFHRQAMKSSIKTAKILQEAAEKAGAPKNMIQWLPESSRENTTALLQHPKTATILATGGPSLVKAAYSSGNPALGVGPGNGPAYIEKTANIERSVYDIVLSKTFDNGMICATENSVVVDEEIYDKVKEEFQKWNCYFLKPNEIDKFTEGFIDPKRHQVRGPIAGRSANAIADMCGIKVPENTKVIIAEYEGVGDKYPLSAEKLSPVLTMYKATSHENAFDICAQLLHYGGEGHTAAIHTLDDDLATKYGLEMRASRIIVNSPSGIGGIGNIYNNMTPSLTLGTGSYGGNSISHNVTDWDLLNIKTIAKRRENRQWVKIPPKVYFQRNSLKELQDIPNINRAFIVTGPGMSKRGYVQRVIDQLRQRQNNTAFLVFDDVEEDPSTNTVEKGVAMMNDFKPDTIIALGGGSPMDAAKAMWMFYEHPETSWYGVMQKYLDIRKRAYQIKKPTKSQLIGIPTTSGTGSEVTPFAVITDSETHVKYPLADYALTPNIAIVDSQFVETVPAKTTAWTGLDVLCHATESYVSVMATDYTRGWSLQTIKGVMENLPKSVQGDKLARRKMHDFSTMAGMAFGQAFLGINHSLAHKMGGAFGLPHGLLIAIAMPQVIRFNAKRPQKLALWPHYETYHATKDYADIARFIGLKGNTDEELAEAYAKKVIELAHECGVKLSLKDNGVTREEFDKAVDDLARLAYEDQCTTTNPVEPLVSQLKELLERCYDGTGVEEK